MLYIFDKDGTLVAGVDRGNGKTRPANTPDEQILLPNVAEKLAQLRSEGHKIAIASNQGGVAWGLISYDDACKLMADCADKIGGADVVDFAPWDSRAASSPNAHPRFAFESEHEAQMRKPAPGMLINIMRYGFPDEIPADQVVMVGDQESDRQSAINAGVSFVWAKDFFGWREHGVA